MNQNNHMKLQEVRSLIDERYYTYNNLLSTKMTDQQFMESFLSCANMMCHGRNKFINVHGTIISLFEQESNIDTMEE